MSESEKPSDLDCEQERKDEEERLMLQRQVFWRRVSPVFLFFLILVGGYLLFDLLVSPPFRVPAFPPSVSVPEQPIDLSANGLSAKLEQRSEKLIGQMLSKGSLGTRADDYLLEQFGLFSLPEAFIMINHPETELYLSTLVNSLLERNLIILDKPLVVKVFDDRFNRSKIEAFSFAGCHMILSLSAVLVAEDELFVGAILGHEAAHIFLRHQAQERRIRRNFNYWFYVFRRAQSWDEEEALNLAWEKTFGFTDLLGRKHFGRWSLGKEEKADQLIQVWLAQAGYNPLVLTRVLEVTLQFNPDLFLEYTDHLQKRISLSRKFAREVGFTGLSRNDKRFLVFDKQKLAEVKKELNNFLKQLDDQSIALIKKQ